jgi:hypothetical protein
VPDELRTLLDNITDERAGPFPYVLWLPAVHWDLPDTVSACHRERRTYCGSNSALSDRFFDQAV